jgi:flagellar biosynthesis chaperone FliJ
MAQVTQTELQELKDLIKGSTQEIKLELSEIKGEIKATNTRLTLLETAVTKLDSRLWLFMGLVLAPTLTAVMGIVVRFVFLGMPNS